MLKLSYTLITLSYEENNDYSIENCDFSTWNSRVEKFLHVSSKSKIVVYKLKKISIKILTAMEELTTKNFDEGKAFSVVGQISYLATT